ncbi:DUF1287 domain-containing protein [bacterium]|jgi:hypothetical protein|nr:DUF1287 domain-containing protein [bacterium]MBT7038186.1 DUF1287 domain-containing protein [bacterium]MBT7431771.1 DUF1287 domain-containing protein [bacterium]
MIYREKTSKLHQKPSNAPTKLNEVVVTTKKPAKKEPTKSGQVELSKTTEKKKILCPRSIFTQNTKRNTQIPISKQKKEPIESIEKKKIAIKNEPREKLLKKTLTSKEKYASVLIENARNFLGHPYDTSWDDVDGFASLEKHNGKYHVLDNFTGKKLISEKKPLVCIDLILESLQKSGNIPSLGSALKNSPHQFYYRRTTNFENFAEKSKDFFVQHPKTQCVFPKKKLSKSIQVQKGDILTTTNLETGSRHIGIVTKIDNNGMPLTIIHSNYQGTVETPFFNSKEKIDQNHGKKRYDGFLPGKAEITSIIRPSNNTMLTIAQQNKSPESLVA